MQRNNKEGKITLIKFKKQQEKMKPFKNSSNSLLLSVVWRNAREVMKKKNMRKESIECKLNDSIGSIGTCSQKGRGNRLIDNVRIRIVDCFEKGERRRHETVAQDVGKRRGKGNRRVVRVDLVPPSPKNGNVGEIEKNGQLNENGHTVRANEPAGEHDGKIKFGLHQVDEGNEEDVRRHDNQHQQPGHLCVGV